MLGFSGLEKPSNEILGKLYDNISNENKSVIIKNYILNVSAEEVVAKSKQFYLDKDIPIISANIVVANLDIELEVIIKKSFLKNISGYDKFFSVSVNDEEVFKNLLCLKSVYEKDRIILRFTPEQQYFLKNSVISKMCYSGNVLWLFQILEHQANTGRDIPIEFQFKDKPLPKQVKKYFFIFGIKGIKISGDIRFGLVNFTNDSGIDLEKEENYIKTMGGEPDCFAQLVILSESLIDAINDAVDLLTKAINILKIILLDDCAIHFFGLNVNPNTWDCEVLKAKLDFTEHFYVEDVINGDNYAIMNYKSKSTPCVIELNHEIEKLLNDENFLEDFFYLGESKSKDDLLQAVFWLNASHWNSNKKEKIISLYNSIEFLVSGQKGITLNSELEARYGCEYENIFGGINEIITNCKNKELSDRLKGIIKNAFEGNSSVKSKLESLLKQLNMDFSNEEWTLFDKLKTSRQHLIHNKKTKVSLTNQELNKLYHIFSKVIIHRINFLQEVDGND